ncbi:auxin efflux carrier component 2-like [Rhodamnia argentea]|uniref:Auxin efflux carrier component n=1 Tax=Rhodamnia argentea TaxID=178133 RepID=A0ABM3HLP8_9MYRT|nr:auxin efflux carrier component 2-like [Rhodamnia argentea]
MISGKDIYKVVEAITPLYVAMILAYASIRFWKIFTPQQCAGINKYVATFAVPILSFHVIATCNFYDMNFRFIGADALQKVVILASLALWFIFSPNASLEWVISFFSLSTLPNTLIIGIPLLQAMYGGSSGSLMVQIVVLQSLIWYTLLLILFEYKGAMILINEQFPDCARAITSIRVDPDVVSLNGREPLEAEAEIDDDGKVRVVVRRSSGSSMESTLRKSLERLSSISITPRASNLSGVEIYSLQSWSRTSSLNKPDGLYGSQKHGNSGSTEAASSLHDSKSTNAQADWIVDAEIPRTGKRSYKGRNQSSESIKDFRFPLHQPSHSIFMTAPGEVPMIFSDNNSSAVPAKGLHMYDWGSSTDKLGYASSRITHGSSDLGGQNFRERLNEHAENASEMNDKEWNAVHTELGMPPGSVMARLVALMVWRKLSGNPNIYASILGLAWSLLSFKLHLRLPLIIEGSIQILSNTGLGMAMFSLGLFMGSQPKLIPCGYSLATLAMALRFIVGPLVAAATSAALGLRGNLLRISILQAALPEGIIPFVFASEYKVHADIMSVAVVFGILVSLPVALLYGVVLAAI